MQTHTLAQPERKRPGAFISGRRNKEREPVLSENANEAAVRSLSPSLLAEFVFGITPARARALSAPSDADANTKRVEAQQWTESAAVCVFIKSPRAGFLEYARRRTVVSIAAH
jgi:hypothetical protein